LIGLSTLLPGIASADGEENGLPDFYQNLIGYWPLDNGRGLTATEKSNFMEGTEMEPSDAVFQNDSGLTWKCVTPVGDGICGYADVNGSVGSFFNIESIGGMVTEDTVTFSIMGWAKPRSFNGYKGIFMTREIEDGTGAGKNYGLSHYQEAHVDSRISGVPVNNPAIPLTVDTWYHIAMTDDGITRKVYINGEEIASADSQQINGIVSSENWGLGFDPGMENRVFDGGLDDFAVFNAGLPACLIKDIYDGGLLGNNLLKSFDSAPEELKSDDTDNDGVCDQVEIDFFGDITTSAWTPTDDIDGDTLPDIDELCIHKTNPARRDTDGDTIDDHHELSGERNVYRNGMRITDDKPGDPTDPLDDDSDGDSLDDGEELTGDCITDPNSSDTDSDGIPDQIELNIDFTDPCDPNSRRPLSPPPSLISYYSFDEGTGDSAADTAPEGTPETAVTNQGTIGWDTTTPLIGSGSLVLSGTASMGVDVPFNTDTKAFTICVWIYANTIAQSRGGILNHRDLDIGNSVFWGISTQSNGGTDYRLESQGNSVPVDTIQTEQWHHLGC